MTDAAALGPRHDRPPHDGADRPQPQYGVYATPEEVARARGMTLDEHLADLSSATARAATPEGAAGDLAPAESAPQWGAASTTPGRPPAPSTQRADAAFARNRFITVALLAFGLVSILTSLPGYLDFDESLRLAFAQQGLDTYQSGDLARSLGITAIVGQLLLWVGALAGSVTALRRRRTAWWIPLVAGVVAVAFVAAILIAAILGDPSFADYVQRTTGG